MKWKCTYQPEEKEEAAADLAALLQRHPGAKVRKSTAEHPKLCVYLTTRKTEKTAAQRESLDHSLPCMVKWLKE